MKPILGGLALTALLWTSAFCQDRAPREPEREMQVRQRQMELEARETEFEFDREMKRLEMDRRKAEIQRLRFGKWLGPLLLVCFVLHILLAVWVYQDIRARNTGSGVWIAVTLLAGFFGALLYAVVRLGDVQEEEET